MARRSEQQVWVVLSDAAFGLFANETFTPARKIEMGSVSQLTLFSF